MEIKIKQVDAFTSIPFGGNPAGVVTDANALSDEQKQKIAREMNLSETAFVSKSDKADFRVQFFTPGAEVDLCGHATIATFHTLYEEGRLDPSKKIFHQETGAGVLPVELCNIDREKVYMMTQAVPCFEDPGIDIGELSAMFGLVPEDIMELPVLKVSTGIWWLVFGMKKLDKLMKMIPNMAAVKEFSRKHKLVGIIPFTPETLDPVCSYHIRAFAPYVGVDEDPVCGTCNGCVSSYIADQGLIQFEREMDLVGEEGFEVKRPGKVYAHLEKQNGKVAVVKIGGSAFTVLEGTMRVAK
ncbi:MAG TPA: PhzF family phenazine biosynthesis protein [Negativicutes bacterium]|nr:PhzF family phenazine biosynthesis protein [Negativicutes bacterium]